MAGECKFEKNFWKFPQLGYQRVLLLYYLSMDVEGDGWGVQINSLLIILQCSTGLGEHAYE